MQLGNIRREELPEVVGLADRTFRQGEGRISMGISFSHLFNDDNVDNLAVAKDGDRIISHIGTLPETLMLHGCSVPVAFMGAVCTDPEYRGHGLASRLFEIAERKMRDEGSALLLVSGGRGLYQRQNCMTVGAMYEFTLDCSMLPAEQTKTDLSVRVVNSDEVENSEMLLAIQERETVHFRRTAASFERLLANASFLAWRSVRSRLILLERGGKVEGYLTAGVYLQEDGTTVGRIIEFAGPDDIVERLLRASATFLDAKAIGMLVPNYRWRLKERLAGQGHAFQTVPIPGTVKVISFPLLWNSIQPYLEKRLGREEALRLILETTENGFRISLGEESRIFDNRGATHLLFNGPERYGDTPLQTALGKVFPIPFDNPCNLNYV